MLTAPSSPYLGSHTSASVGRLQKQFNNAEAAIKKDGCNREYVKGNSSVGSHASCVNTATPHPGTACTRSPRSRCHNHQQRR